MNQAFDTPILLITYKREDTTRKVIDSLRDLQPSRIFFVANAPNPANPKDPQQCQSVRDLVRTIDWPCEVVTNFRTKHLNARESISGSITWFFENVEEGIILEDDCICDQSFFHYCRENLDRYRDNERVMHISATNFNPNYKGNGDSYYFSRYAFIWGWATWRRAWRHFSLNMEQIDKASARPILEKVFSTRMEVSFWLAMHAYLSSGNIDTWDGQWVFAVFKEQGLCLTPTTNLINNVGFDANATNTSGQHDLVDRMVIGSLDYPITHPVEIAWNDTEDLWTGKHLFKMTRSWWTFHAKIRLATVLTLGAKKKIKKWLGR